MGVTNIAFALHQLDTEQLEQLALELGVTRQTLLRKRLLPASITKPERLVISQFLAREKQLELPAEDMLKEVQLGR